MELSRRDALAVLAGLGAAGAGAYATDFGPFDGDGDHVTDVLVAVARVVYPSDVEGVEEFVRTYVVGRADGRPEYRRGVADAAATIDEYARAWYETPFVELDEETRDALLREMGVDAADPDPNGPDAGTVRYYVVNELLYALYASPTGGELVGIENPQGHPGGHQSYQRGPHDG